MPQWIDFIEGPPKPKTRTWLVIGKKSSATLGWIQWYGPWRSFAFYPEPHCVFEEDCLRDIANFCEQQTTQQKKCRQDQTDKSCHT